MSLADEQTQRELQQFLEIENEKAKFQARVYQLTDLCWKKCMTGKLGNKLDSSEQTCIMNCVDRFFDTYAHYVDRFSQERH